MAFMMMEMPAKLKYLGNEPGGPRVGKAITRPPALARIRQAYLTSESNVQDNFDRGGNWAETWIWRWIAPSCPHASLCCNEP
jgi:hypothetical protein